MLTTDDMYMILLNYKVATIDEIQLVCSICGYNNKTLEDILYSRTGLRSFDQLVKEDNEE